MDQSILQDQFSLGFLSVWIIQRLKALKWLPFIHGGTDQLNRFTSALLAAAAQVGLTVHYDPTGGVMTVAGLTLTSAVSFVLAVVWQGAIQEGLYRGLFKRGKNGSDSVPAPQAVKP